MDEDLREGGTLARVDALRHFINAFQPFNGKSVRNAKALSDRHQTGAKTGMAALHARLAKMAVVEHDDGQVGRLLGTNGAQAADAHELFTVAGNDDHRLLRLGQRETQAERGRTAHRAPQVEIS